MAMSRKTEAGGIPAGVGKGLLVAVLTSLLSAGIFAVLIQNGTIQEDAANPWAVATLVISSLIGCLLAVKGVGGKYAVVSIATSGAFAFILLACGILFFNDPFAGLVRNLLSVLAGGVAASVFSLKNPVKRRKVKARVR